MARILYTLLFYLLTPLLFLRLLWRSRRQTAYRHNLAERLGIYNKPQPATPLIWIHAVSVGETRATQPLVTALQQVYPDHRILLTGMTPTGRDAGRALYGSRIIQAYLPYDYPGATRRFLRYFQPKIGLLMETEIWPNLLHACRQQRIPILLLNARLSERSARRYQQFQALSYTAMQQITCIAAQTPADLQRFKTLGAPRLEVHGNLKFDVTPAPDQIAQGKAWRNALGERRVWLAASTREGEEVILIELFQKLRHTLPPDAQDTLLVLVPRHPQRFAEVEQHLQQSPLQFSRRSQGLPGTKDQVWLGDSMGEMPAYYSLADIAFVGGSLLPLGGQNLIEAAACACPVLIGPHTFNFAQATRDAITAGAARQVSNEEELLSSLTSLLNNPAERKAMAEAARHFAQAHQGATQKAMGLIRKVLPPPAAH